MYDVVHDVVAEAAGEELPVVTGLARLDEAAVVRRLGTPGERREPLGFGLGEVVVLVTPVVWLVLDQTAKQIAGSVADGASRQTKALLRKVFRRGRGERAVMPALTRQQLAEVRQRILEAAAQRGLPADRAETIADAVVARLVLVEPPSEDGAE
ncbi:hypothetical protein [Kibdelosporangium phytohabitans]|uniref:Uncharacterized protein n=1 Tax=Kibdelosporangium phytohabitans TaxID=860235 RepID=A0A0N9HYM3_9PSEU|nr:hypothetical protein [Kibdelosporangium phytohabitans]ALG10524.1 hypothetical protein AOZ06_29775 [Kibdelosporangium phytohabitans]